MSRQRRRDTGPELVLRRLLHARGLRYRVDAPLPGLPRGRADLLFPAARVAVFVHGCFWHCCPEHASWPRANGDWWAEKLRGNVARDVRTCAHLEEAGWTVLVVWEHEDPHEAARRVEQIVRAAVTGRAGSTAATPVVAR